MRVGDCIYFTGIQYKVCKAGVNYEDFSGHRIPCIPGTMRLHSPFWKAGYKSCSCSSFQAMTKGEAEILQAKFEIAAEKMLASLVDGKCHICGAQAEPLTRKGRCIYNACGHRRGQI